MIRWQEKNTHTCYVLETVQLRPKKKRHQLLHAENSTNETDKKKDKQLLRTRNSITDTPSSWFSCVLLEVRAANAGSGQQQLRARRVHPLWCIPDAPKQRARYHALHELLGFHISFEELVKRKKYLVLRLCPTLVQSVVCCSLLTVAVYGETWLSACRAP